LRQSTAEEPYADTYKSIKSNKVTYKRPMTGHTRNKTALTNYSGATEPS